MTQVQRDLTALAALDEDVRRALYEAVRAADHPVTREEAAQQVNVSRKLAAFHLDKLVSVGLLTTAAAPGPRQVGRAPKAYVPVSDAVNVSVPPRSYADLASILLDAMADQAADESTAEATLRVAARRGRELGERVRRTAGFGRGRDAGTKAVRAALAEAGYEPDDTDTAGLRLRNCPFHPLAEEHAGFVCGVNGAFLSGLLEGTNSVGLSVVPRPPGRQCCAEIQSDEAVRNNGRHDRAGNA